MNGKNSSKDLQRRPWARRPRLAWVLVLLLGLFLLLSIPPW
jgi:polyferredoxin